jgi:hypothetical protein
LASADPPAHPRKNRIPGPASAAARHPAQASHPPKSGQTAIRRIHQHPAIPNRNPAKLAPANAGARCVPKSARVCPKMRGNGRPIGAFFHSVRVEWRVL